MTWSVEKACELYCRCTVETDQVSFRSKKKKTLLTSEKCIDKSIYRTSRFIGILPKLTKSNFDEKIVLSKCAHLF